jgi:xylose isomerase
MSSFFEGIPALAYAGPDSEETFIYRHYNPDEMVMGKRLEDHLRFAVAYWHSFAWPGGDPFGGQTFDRPWFGDTMDLARLKADAAFEMFAILGAPILLLPRRRHAARGRDFAGEPRQPRRHGRLYRPQDGGNAATRLLWGTANLFSHRRFMAGAATNPDPDVFAWSAATVKTCMDATTNLGGENYVLVGRSRGL